MSLFPDELFGEVKTKYCKKCNRTLPASNFGNACGGNYLYSECRECTKRLSKIRKSLREQYPMLEPEKYICPICNISFKDAMGTGGARLKSPWVMDHDHTTGKYRGYICHSCNRGLGIFQDSIDTLNNAINYLKETND